MTSKYAPVIDHNGKLVRLSVSQISRFQSCQRKWWYRYVGGLPEPESPAANVGKDGHKRLETYFKGEPQEDGTTRYSRSGLSPMEIPALSYLPAPGPDVFPEVELTHLKLAGVAFAGSADLVDTNGYIVYDYKFQSSPRPFKEPTVQMWGYLEEMRIRFDLKTTPLRFRFIGINKKPPHGVKVSPFDVTCSQVAEAWKAYEPVVESMHLAAEKKHAQEVSASPAACYEYGRCPYFDVCEKNDTELSKIILGGDSMSFLDELETAKKEIPHVPGVLEAKVMPPDAGPQPVPIQDSPQEVPDSSPAWSPKAEKKASKKASTKVVTVRYSKKPNFERVLGPQFKYESREIELTIQEEGVSEEELLTTVMRVVDKKMEEEIARLKGEKK